MIATTHQPATLPLILDWSCRETGAEGINGPTCDAQDCPRCPELIARNEDRPVVAVTGRWSLVYDRAAYDAAFALARGDYQRNILNGTESLSGSTLRGKARHYGAVYARSRRNLIARCRGAGISIGEVRGERGARILTIG